MAVSFAALTLLACGGGRTDSPSIEPSVRIAGADLDTAPLTTRLLLIGDAGDPRLLAGTHGMLVDEPVLALAERWAARVPQHTLVVFLGDNAYQDGIPLAGPRADSARVRLGAQLDVVARSGARGLFVPGHHDWGFGREGVLRQQQLVVERLGPDSFLPAGASGGPALVSLDGVELIVLDTQWWLARNRRRRCETPHVEVGAAMDSLRTLLAHSQARHRVLVAHHPLDTYGDHRGAGALRSFATRLTGGIQDLATPAYTCLRRQLDSVLGGPRRPLVAAGGHEHSLQVLDGGAAAEYILVSGAGSSRRVERVGRGSPTRYAEGSGGFLVLDFLADGRVLLHAVVVGADADGRISYGLQLR
jgi:hypothetical protein